MSFSRVSFRLLLLTLAVFTVSGLPQILAPDQGSTIRFSSSQVKGCRVCSGAGSSKKCSPSFLEVKASVLLDFECSKPQDVFSVEIERNIECSTKSCSGHIIQSHSDSLRLLDFNRKFTWKLKASAPKAVKIDFTNTGLRQINPSERCPDRHSYTLQAFETSGKVAVGKYCRTGPVTNAQILNQSSFSVDVPARLKLQNGRFDVSVGEEIKTLAKITLTLPKGMSSSELLSPNYPDSFPDDDVMEWYFQVPDKHKTVVQFFNLTQPKCLKKEPAVEYQGKGRGALVLKLTDPQETQYQGDFSLLLRNCEMDRRRAGSSGLSLNLKVSSSSSSQPVMCKVDVSRMEGLSLHIEKLKHSSDCEMKIKSLPKEKIAVTSKTELMFKGCLPEDVQITATRVIECRRFRDCPKTPVRLSMPVLQSCLPAPLTSVTWTLRPPDHGTVELTSASGPLKQSLPGQECNDSIIIKMAEDDDTPIGTFCPQGAIQKLQIHTNVTVTASGMKGQIMRTAMKHVLSAIMKEEISEQYIFTVAPKKDAPVLLGTPGWPKGMKPSSTVSWIVSVPPKMEAHLMFPQVNQPKCSTHHTGIKVQRVGCPEEEYSRREDEERESELTVSDNFYLNMSNCVPERDDFSVIAKITLQKSKNVLLTTILSVVASLLVIFVIVLVVVCVVIRKKKKKLNHEVSIYNPNGTVFLPGQNGFPKAREDDDAHVYESIEDTLVYTHLLRKGAEMGVYGEFDTHQPFHGHTDSQKPLVSRNTGADDMPVGAYQDFQHAAQQAPPLPNRPPSHHVQPMVDNEIYQSEEEQSPNLGLRLEPEGGN
ncbi:CUB domain-containing protein 1a [Centropristis striata]|uniref:CUB domain-containing protein 1a n=1 Tax=Centropristis striata TaxID=184440 RepID=UPI0027DFED51|nr:CUB domain-containing protein 1a [Centropristis striata]